MTNLAPYKDKSTLSELYLNQKLSSIDIGKMFSVAHTTVLYFMDKYKIPRRDKKQSVALGRANDCNIDGDAFDFLCGEILGDMYVGTHRGHSGHIGYGTKHLSYAKWLLVQLGEMGIELSGNIRPVVDTRWGCKSYQFSTKSYTDLMVLRSMFYPVRKKIVPDGIELNPLTLRQLYIGDGSLKQRHRCAGDKPIIQIASCGFDVDSVNTLVAKLNGLGFIASRWPNNNSIGISTHSAQDFLNYIGPCPVPCYEYKWAIT